MRRHPCTATNFTYDASGNLTSKWDAVRPTATRPSPRGHERQRERSLSIRRRRQSDRSVRHGASRSSTPPSICRANTTPPRARSTFNTAAPRSASARRPTDSVTLYLGGFYERVEDRSSSTLSSGTTSAPAIASSPSTSDEAAPRGSRQPTSRRPTSTPTTSARSTSSPTPRATVVERRSYDAFGARREPVWDATTQPKSFDSPGTTLGYTGQESDDELGLVNMKGRIYDPKLARFLTPDPLVSRPLSGQSWNRYSYVLNNPLRYVDPSGFEPEIDRPFEVSIERPGTPPPELTNRQQVRQHDSSALHQVDPTRQIRRRWRPPANRLRPSHRPATRRKVRPRASPRPGSGPAANRHGGTRPCRCRLASLSRRGVDRRPVDLRPVSDPRPPHYAGSDFDTFGDANSSLLAEVDRGRRARLWGLPAHGEEVSLLRSAGALDAAGCSAIVVRLRYVRFTILGPRRR